MNRGQALRPCRARRAADCRRFGSAALSGATLRGAGKGEMLARVGMR